MNRDFATRLTEDGIAAAIEHALEEHENWLTDAHEAFEAFLVQAGNVPFTCEMFREFAYRRGLAHEAPDERAWGGIIRYYSRRKFIERIGFTQCQNPLAHKAFVSLWRKT